MSTDAFSKTHRVMVRRYAGGWGDILVSTVALRAARQKFPDSYICYAVGLPYLAFITGTAKRGADECIAPPKWGSLGDAAFVDDESGNWALAGYDVVINLTGEVEHAHQSNWKITKNRQEIWCDQVGVRPENMVPKFHISRRERLAMVSDIMKPNGLELFSYIVVGWCSRDRAKDYPHMADLVRILRERGHTVVIMHDDFSKVPEFGEPPVYTTHGLCPDDCGIIVESAKLVITPDSLPLHLAASVGCPALGLFSSTDGALTCKYYEHATVLQNGNTQGKPCDQTTPCYGIWGNNYWCGGREAPDTGLPWCLEQIPAFQVAIMAEELLEKHKDLNAVRLERVANELHEAARVKIDTSKIKKQKTIVVGTLAGIGDSLWSMTALQAIMREDGADGLVMVQPEGKPARGKEFLQRFDFVDDARYAQFPTHPPAPVSHINPDGTYRYLETKRNHVGLDWFLCPNTPLEQGKPLDSWLPEYPKNFSVAKHFKFTDQDKVVADLVAKQVGSPYVVFFLGGEDSNGRCGHNRSHSYSKHEWEQYGYLPELYVNTDPRPIWRLDEWLVLGKHIIETGCAIVIVGAKYDASFARKFVELWKQTIQSPTPRLFNYCGQFHIAESLAVIRGARACVSYQSGIGISAVYFGIPTVMWWRARFDSLEPPMNRVVSFDEQMRYAWVPPWASDSYLGFIYGRETARQIFAAMNDKHFVSEDKPRGWDLVP